MICLRIIARRRPAYCGGIPAANAESSRRTQDLRPRPRGIVSRLPRGGSRETSGGRRQPRAHPFPAPARDPPPGRNPQQFRHVPPRFPPTPHERAHPATSTLVLDPLTATIFSTAVEKIVAVCAGGGTECPAGTAHPGRGASGPGRDDRPLRDPEWPAFRMWAAAPTFLVDAPGGRSVGRRSAAHRDQGRTGPEDLSEAGRSRTLTRPPNGADPLLAAC